VAHGVIAPDEPPRFSERLLHLFEAIAAVIAEHAPDEAAVEETFMNNNAASALKLGHARACAMLAPGPRRPAGRRIRRHRGQEVRGRHRRRPTRPRSAS
jgi:Holliday junction resolvasome RuvABC endonuclease subunit